MTIYSHSRLQTFKNCKLRFKYNYVDRIKSDRKSIESYMGNRFHEAMEKLYGELKYKKPELSEIIDYYNSKWDKKWSDNIFLVRENMRTEDYRAMGAKAIENYYKHYDPFSDSKVLGIERELPLSLDEAGNYKLRCIIDRLDEKPDGTFEIHDYKTSSNKLPEQSKLDEDVQLALYSMAVKNAWPNVKNIDLVWHYVTFDKEMRSKRSEEQLQKIREETIAVIQEIESTTEYSPNETNLCNWCEYKNICPLFSHGENLAKLEYEKMLQDDGLKLVDKYTNLENHKKNLKSEIDSIENKQEYVKRAIIEKAEKENVKRFYGSDKFATIKNDVKVNYPKSNEITRPDFENKMKQLGFWEKVTDVSWSAMKSLVKKGEWSKGIPNELSEFVNIEDVKLVSFSKKKNSEDH